MPLSSNIYNKNLGVCGIKQGGEWWHDNSGLRKFSSHSKERKAASAQIAKIPFPLASWIAQVYKPRMKASA
jgi:hypothetical protein